MKHRLVRPLRAALVLSLALAGVPAAPAAASLLLYEGFNYGPADQTVTGIAANPGVGLSGPYTQVGGYGSSYDPAGLALPGLPAQGGRLEAGNAATYVKTIEGIALDGGFPGVTGSLYLSYLFRVDGTTATIQPVSVSVNSSVTGAAATNLLSVSAAASTGTPGIRYGTLYLNAAQPLATGTTYLLVARFTNVGATLSSSAPGKATLWVLSPDQFATFQASGLTDATLDAATVGPAPTAVTARVVVTATSGRIAPDATDALQASIASSGTGIVSQIDEIRLGTALADVVAPVPSFGSSDPDLIPAGRKVLHYLKAIQGSYVVAGQFEDDNTEGVETSANTIEGITGLRPALIGMDVGDNEVDPFDEARDLWQAGVIVQLNWHVAAPTPPLREDGPYFAKRVVTPADIAAAMTPGTEQYGYFTGKLDAAAARLAELQAAGIPVLWRPFHEANGHWFWWSDGDGDGSAAYVQLYRFMWNYFTTTKGLHNLIWVWAPSGDKGTIPASFYPGDAYVDLGGADCYHARVDTTWAGQFANVQAVSHRSAAALTECDLLPNPDLLCAAGANWVYWMGWSGSSLDQDLSDGVVRDPAHTNAIYHNAHTIHSGLLPDWDAYQSPLPSRDAYADVIRVASFNADSGVALEVCGDVGGGLDVGPVQDGQYVAFSSVDFGTSGSTYCSVRIAGTTDATIEVHLDSLAATRKLSLSCHATGGTQTWKTVGWAMTGVTGVHSVYLVFKGAPGPLLRLNWVQFQ